MTNSDRRTNIVKNVNLYIVAWAVDASGHGIIIQLKVKLMIMEMVSGTV